jgi:hypothetical protein
MKFAAFREMAHPRLQVTGCHYTNKFMLFFSLRCQSNNRKLTSKPPGRNMNNCSYNCAYVVHAMRNLRLRFTDS